MRLDKAKQFLRSAERSLNEDDLDAATGYACNSGIASADTICAVRLGLRNSNHNETGAFLKQADQSLVSTLERLLGIRHRALYDDEPVTRKATQDSVERAKKLLAAAQVVLQHAPPE